MLSMVRMVSGRHGGHAAEHAQEVSGGACVNVQILLHQMEGSTAEAWVQA